MRAFVAVEVAPAGHTPRAPEHVTLRFLGEISEEQRRRTEARLGEVSRRFAPFVIRIEGVGAFPEIRHPRVVWVGVSVGRAELTALGEAVRSALTEEFGAERGAFVPHLTLFRVRSPEDRRAAEELLQGGRPAPPARDVAVREVLLKESQLGRNGAVHRTLASFPLLGERRPA